jgi:hypothetical protein
MTTPDAVCGWPATHWGGQPAWVRVSIFLFSFFEKKKLKEKK